MIEHIITAVLAIVATVAGQHIYKWTASEGFLKDFSTFKRNFFRFLSLLLDIVTISWIGISSLRSLVIWWLTGDVFRLVIAGISSSVLIATSIIVGRAYIKKMIYAHQLDVLEVQNRMIELSKKDMTPEQYKDEAIKIADEVRINSKM